MIRQLMMGGIVLIALTVAPVTQTHSATERCNVSPDHSIVGFSVAHRVVSNSLASEEQPTTQHHEHVAATPHDHVHGTLPASGMSPEDDLEYSRFVHHFSGVALLVLGSLLLMDRWTAHKHRFFMVGVGGSWLVLGAFLLASERVFPSPPLTSGFSTIF